MKKRPDLAHDEPPKVEDMVAPARSAGFQQLLQLAERQSLDQAALSRLLWLLNAHPRLLGHQRCFENLNSLLCTPEFIDGLGTWAGAWIADVPAWQAITAWACRLHQQSAEGLEDFVRQPRNDRHHLLMRHGINRHPGAGAVWTRHHDDPIPALPTAGLKAPSYAFRLLQWHLFCSQAETRYESSTLDQYLQYDLPDEWPAWPRPAAAVGLALRDFSYPRWDTLLIDLPQETRLDAFVADLVNDKEALLQRYDSGEARQRTVALISYFEAIHDVLEGRPAERRRGGGGGRGGSRRGIPGFIHFSVSPRVFFEPPEPDTDDEDVPTRNFTRVHFHTEEITPAANADLEDQDIAPGEDLQPVMDLFPAEARPGGICSLWAARQAIESAAQHHFWDKSQLTPVEVAALLDAIELTSSPPNAACNEEAAAEPRLLLRTMLLLGCPMEEARTIRVMTLSGFAEAVSTGQPVATRLLLVSEDGEVCKGFAIPAISPRYAARPKEAFKRGSTASGICLTLPDSTALGMSLLAHKKTRSADIEGPVFQEPAFALQAAVKLILDAANHGLDARSRPRVTLTKVTRKLPALLGRQGLGEIGIALVCGDQRYASQARLHYTQYPVAQLTKAYARAVKRLLGEGGRFVITPSSPRDHISDSVGDDVVGARLIVRHDDLCRLMVKLRAEISSRPTPSRSGRHRYHQTYLLYTLLMQGLMTGIRPSSDPDRLVSEILQHQTPPGCSRIIQSVVEKDNQYESRARAVSIPGRLQLQLSYLCTHAQATWRWQPTDLVLPDGDQPHSMFVDWSDSATEPRAAIIRPQWIADQLHAHGLPAAANFHRGYLRTRLLKQACPETVIDAFLGHAPVGQSLHNLHAAFDFDHHLREVTAHLERIATDLGLVPLQSLLADSDCSATSGHERAA